MPVDSLQVLIGQLLRAGHLLGHGGLDEPVGKREPAFERKRLGDL